MDLGFKIDRQLGIKLPTLAPLVPVSLGCAGPGGAVPHIVLKLRDMLVVHKPPGWEVDLHHPDSAPCLGFWPQRVPSSLSHDGVHRIGCAHRLDTPCSGILLAGKTSEAGHFLQWQLHVDGLLRNYVVHSNGRMPCYYDIDAPLFHCASVNVAIKTGKPSRTQVAMLSHVG